MIDLENLSEAALSIEPLPTSVTRLAALVSRGVPDLNDVVEIVAFDQVLTATLLRAANSSWSAAQTEITTVKDAVVRLGAGPVLSIALGTSVHGRLTSAVPAYGLAEGELWQHSVAAMLAAEALSGVATRRPPAETPTAALLHDFGKLVIARYVDPVDLHALETAHELGLARTATEHEVLGVDHAELGGLIAQAWQLPDPLVAGIMHHHAPQDHNGLIAYAVHVANVAAKTIGVDAEDGPDLETFTRAIGELGITADAYDDVCATVAERFEEVVARFE